MNLLFLMTFLLKTTRKTQSGWSANHLMSSAWNIFHNVKFNDFNDSYRLCDISVGWAFRTMSYVLSHAWSSSNRWENNKHRSTGCGAKMGTRLLNPLPWDISMKGRCTNRLIPDTKLWSTRKHGELDYCLKRLLTVRVCFRAYLHWFRRPLLPEACILLLLTFHWWTGCLTDSSSPADARRPSSSKCSLRWRRVTR